MFHKLNPEETPASENHASKKRRKFLNNEIDVRNNKVFDPQLFETDPITPHASAHIIQITKLIETEEEKLREYIEDIRKYKQGLRNVEEKISIEIDNIRQEFVCCCEESKNKVANQAKEQSQEFLSIENQIKDFREEIAVTDKDLILFKSHILVMEENIGKYRVLKKY